MGEHPPMTTSKPNDANSEPPMTMPAFALANAVVDVSLSSSASSAISGSASQHIRQEAPAADHSASAATEAKSDCQAAADTQPCIPAPATVSHVPVAQLLSELDSVKWGQVAAWAARDSAQAADLVEHLGPCIAESVASDADRDHALLRLEAQVARKKLVRRVTQFDLSNCVRLMLARITSS